MYLMSLHCYNIPNWKLYTIVRIQQLCNGAIHINIINIVVYLLKKWSIGTGEMAQWGNEFAVKTYDLSFLLEPTW